MLSIHYIVTDLHADLIVSLPTRRSSDLFNYQGHACRCESQVYPRRDDRMLLISYQSITLLQARMLTSVSGHSLYVHHIVLIIKVTLVDVRARFTHAVMTGCY